MSDFLPPPPRGELKWYAIDFDQTIATGTWSVDTPNAVPGPPIVENVAKLNDVVARGHKVAIHTSRGWNDYELIESWLKHYGVHFDKIVCGKLLAAVYVDDRAVHASEDVWGLPVDPERSS